VLLGVTTSPNANFQNSTIYLALRTKLKSLYPLFIQELTTNFKTTFIVCSFTWPLVFHRYVDYSLIHNIFTSLCFHCELKMFWTFVFHYQHKTNEIVFDYVRRKIDVKGNKRIWAGRLRIPNGTKWVRTSKRCTPNNDHLQFYKSLKMLRVSLTILLYTYLLHYVSSTTEWFGDLRAHLNPESNPAFYDVTYDDDGKQALIYFSQVVLIYRLSIRTSKQRCSQLCVLRCSCRYDVSQFSWRMPYKVYSKFQMQSCQFLWAYENPSKKIIALGQFL
jgi:hypothetical protein